MFLTSSNLVHYLLARGLLPAAAVVNGDFMVAEAGRRNRNYKILLKNSPGLFVKQIKNFETMAISTLQREAACYRIAQQRADYNSLASIMTRLIDHDAHRHCLIIELLANAENLNEYHLRTKTFPVEIAKLLGVSIGYYHQSLRNKPLSAEEMTAFPRQLPWILTYHHSQSFIPGNYSGGTMQLLEIVKQYPDLHYNLDRLRQHWHYDSLIHGDIKWDNCMVYPDNQGRLALKIIDWELVDYGDACWDVGAVLQAYLTSWIYSMPIMQETSPDRLVDQAGYHLESMYPSIKAFWHSYLQTSGLPAQHADHYLIRSIEYSAARMVQTAFESLFFSQTMTNPGAILLQVSLNILRNPRDAASALFGFSEGVAA